LIHSKLLKRGTWLLHRLLLATGPLVLLATSASADPEIAWLDAGQGKLLRTQGGAVVELETGIARATGLAIDAECGLHYMSGATLFRKDLGTGVKTTVTTLPTVLTRDITADDVAFISTQRSIEKITFTPVVRSTSPFSTINAPRAVAIAPALGKLYWVDSGNYVGTAFSYNAIRRMNLNGTSVESLVSTTAARALAIDEDSGVMFWAENTSPVAIKKALLNGSGVSTVTSSGFTYVSHLSFGGGFLYALDVDGVLKKIHPTTGVTRQRSGPAFRSARVSRSFLTMTVTRRSTATRNVPPIHSKRSLAYAAAAPPMSTATAIRFLIARKTVTATH
jgi:hypothetical protein